MARPKKNTTVNEPEKKVAQDVAENVKLAETSPAEAQNTTPARAAPQQEIYTKDQVQAMIDAALEKQKAQMAPQIIQINADSEKVQFLWQAEVANENVYEIGPNGMYGRIVGKTGGFYVPKADLSRVMDAMFRLMLKKRWIIAVDGLTAEEREAYGVDYREGELLDKQAFAKMVNLREKMLDIYPRLCEGHREMVAKRYHEAFAEGNVNVTREIVVELNRMSKELGGGEGDFKDIIEAMNERDMA